MDRKIELIRSKRRTLAIQVTSDGRVVVRAPIRYPVSEINRFIGEKADWIDRHLEKVRDIEKKEPITKQEVKYLVTKAKRVIPPKVEHFAKLIGVDYGTITIRMQKSRWGSCTAKGNLNFNCLLMKTPDEVIDYIDFGLLNGVSGIVITLMAQRTGNAYPLDRMLFMQ